MIACLGLCGRIGVRRGLCMSCYNQMAAKVRQGRTTWEKEIKARRVLASGNDCQHRFRK